MFHRLFHGGMGLLVLCACAADPAPAPRTAKRAAVEDDAPIVSQSLPSSEAEIGGLSGYDVERQFRALHPRVIACVHDASSRLEVIGGSVSVRMRVDREGNVRWAYLPDTSLGDRDAERCVLDLVKSRQWPRPKGGEGLAEASFEVEPIEAPDELSDSGTRQLAKRARAAARPCMKGIRGEFVATAYIGPDGRVMAAGVAPPNEDGEEAADCISDALLALRVVRRDRKPLASKTSFSLR